MEKYDIKISGRICGEYGCTVKVPVSKSEAHRMLICAALADSPCGISIGRTNDDIEATVSALRALGAAITEKDGVFFVEPVKEVNKGALIDAKESGSTLRFLLPVAAALGADAAFTGEGRLPERPLSPLCDLMRENGVNMSEKCSMPLVCRGKLVGDRFEIDGGVSSQFITGLMLASPLISDRVTVAVTGKPESKPYIDITAGIMRKFGVNVEEKDNVYTVSGKYRSPGGIKSGGDWSGAAFWMVAGALSRRGLAVEGAEIDSAQGDRAIIFRLHEMGADILCGSDVFFASSSKLHGTEIDCADIPDLVPVLSVAASFAGGKTVFHNISRLRAKESDRVAAIISLAEAFGINAGADLNTLTIEGGVPKSIRPVDSFGDHRIAMAAAIEAVSSGDECIIRNAGCVSKSYPAFFEDLSALGAKVEIIK